jgi:hypothetical protein
MPVTHATVVTGSNDPNKQVSKDAWNEGHSVSVEMVEIDATGTPSASTYLRGDGAWVDPKNFITYTITDGGSVDIDPANGEVQLWTLGDNRTPTATNFANGQSVTLMIDDGTAYAITWTIVNKWFGGAPTLSTTELTGIVLFKAGGVVYGAALSEITA